jgi:hypothetical protein
MGMFRHFECARLLKRPFTLMSSIQSIFYVSMSNKNDRITIEMFGLAVAAAWQTAARSDARCIVVSRSPEEMVSHMDWTSVNTKARADCSMAVA